MGTKAELDLVKAVLDAKGEVNADFKYFMNKVVSGRSGKVTLAPTMPYCPISTGTFSTKFKVEQSGITLDIKVKLKVDVYTRLLDGEIHDCIRINAVGAGFKNDRWFSEESPFFLSYLTASVRNFELDGPKDTIDVDEMLGEVIQRTVHQLTKAKEREEAIRRAREYEEARSTKIKAEMLAEHGFVENEVVNKALDNACQLGRSTSETRRLFAWYAEMLKCNPFKGDPQSN